MNILVTGGCGFIGSHLVESLLKKNYKVFVIDNLSNGRKENLAKIKNKKNLRVYISDITKKNQINKYFKNIDIVFHLAALADIVPSIEKPRKYLCELFLLFQGQINFFPQKELLLKPRILFCQIKCSIKCFYQIHLGPL